MFLRHLLSIVLLPFLVVVIAPWDPTRRLVVAGPYRFVRNPMISGVALMLLGEAAFCPEGFSPCRARHSLGG